VIAFDAGTAFGPWTQTARWAGIADERIVVGISDGFTLNRGHAFARKCGNSRNLRLNIAITRAIESAIVTRLPVFTGGAIFTGATIFTGAVIAGTIIALAVLTGTLIPVITLAVVAWPIIALTVVAGAIVTGTFFTRFALLA
jgi:hypothetical protein